VLSIGIITAGGGYQYLTKEVTSGAEDYYIRAGAGAGEAQGWWLGGQQQAFGVNGELVREEQMKAFFGTKSDPETGERLGAKFRIYATVAERLAKAETAHQGWVEADLATRAAALQTARASDERWAESLAAHGGRFGAVDPDPAEDRAGGGAQQCGRIRSDVFGAEIGFGVVGVRAGCRRPGHGPGRPSRGGPGGHGGPGA
jgi:TrwC relaxase